MTRYGLSRSCPRPRLGWRSRVTRAELVLPARHRRWSGRGTPCQRWIAGFSLTKILLLCAAVGTATTCALGAIPVTPGASPEARALLNFISSTYGKQTLSGQMWTPWGVDEISTLQEITGKLPAIRGQDYIHERSNGRENRLAIEWWAAGGIPTIMWHWGAPSKGEGYNQSKMSIDIDRCFERGTAEYTAMWEDLERIADHLTELRDAKVPILWRPMHEFDGGWFWYGKGVHTAFDVPNTPVLNDWISAITSFAPNKPPSSA